ncbi:preprotein translocase subunit SecE [Oxalobacteraceae bacterium GrIS 1.11]
MPTIRQYFYKSIKNFIFTIVSIIIFILLCVVVDWLLPSKIHSGLVIFSLSFINEIGIFIGFMICLFFGHKFFKVIKTEKLPKQEFMKMMPIIIIWLVIILLFANFIAGLDDGIDCKKFNYNEKLNGGVKEFNGKKYTVNICGSGVNNSHFFGDNMDKVQLTIHNDQGELLAKRHYKVFWDDKPGHEPLTVGKDSITYQDDEKQQDYSITIPPTLIDWIRAKVPFF